MIKYFCDSCGKEMSDDEVQHRFRRKFTNTKAKILVEVVTAVNVNGTWNSGHVCGACIQDIVLNGEKLAHFEKNSMRSNLRTGHDLVDTNDEE